MNDRIHRYLDGELSRESLTPQDLMELEAYQEALHEAEAAYKSVEVPDLAGAVMARLPAEVSVQAGARDVHLPVATDGAPGSLGGVIKWFWTPRPLRLRPAWGVLAAAALILLIIRPFGDPVPSQRAPESQVAASEAHASARLVFVQFRLEAPEASTVRLAGTFTGWEPDYALHQTDHGVWAILVPLEPGVHDYAFVVDGSQWVADPAAPWVEDGFGGVNSRLSVLLPNGTSES
jgi:hypothetical protein